MSDASNRPIIVKKVKRVDEGGHHGGAWKVAYADFVTAMMAFFMLMWLLNATTEKQRKGLADYFSPTVAVSRSSGGGDGALGGRSVASDATLVRLGTGGVAPTDVHGTSAEEGRTEAIEAALIGQGGDSLLDREEARHVTVRLTDEGTVVELFDLPGSPLFDGTRATPVLEGLLTKVVPLLRQDGGYVAIGAFAAAEPVVTRTPRAWQLSTDRAQEVRALLPRFGLPERRVARLVGHGDRRPAADDPLALRNNRLEFVLLRRGISP
jgi:chemotaxis protein MotB